jgi:hypothetical protein
MYCTSKSIELRDRMNLKHPIYFSTGLTEKVSPVSKERAFGAETPPPAII